MGSDEGENRVSLRVSESKGEIPSEMYQRLANSGQFVVDQMHRLGLTVARIAGGKIVAG